MFITGILMHTPLHMLKSNWNNFQVVEIILCFFTCVIACVTSFSQNFIRSNTICFLKYVFDDVRDIINFIT